MISTVNMNVLNGYRDKHSNIKRFYVKYYYAIKQIGFVMQQCDRVVILHDYDADGITSAYIWNQMAKKMGLDTLLLHPCRIKHGYGLTPLFCNDIEDKIKPNDYVLCLDMASNSIDELDRLSSKANMLTVVDHHQITTESIQRHVNKDYIVINPYPMGIDICTAGLSYLIYRALRKDNELDDKVEEMAAIGVVADVSTMRTRENRYIVQRGLRAMRKKGSFSSTLNNLMDEPKILNMEFLKFYVCPTINAMGRLDSVGDKVYVLTNRATDLTGKIGISEFLSSDIFSPEIIARAKFTNEKRRAIVASMLLPSKKGAMVSNKLSHLSYSYIIDPKFSNLGGMIGLLAQNMKNSGSLTSFAGVKINENTIKFSIRSADSIDIIKCLTEAELDGMKFGGHAGAAGMEIDTVLINPETVFSVINMCIASQKVDRHINNVTQIYTDNQDELKYILKFFREIKVYGRDYECPEIYYRRTRVI